MDASSTAHLIDLLAKPFLSLPSTIGGGLLSLLSSAGGLYCQAANSAAKSIASWFWTAVVALWPWYWAGIVALLVSWTLYEIFSGNGRSENGFSPAYNRVVGSGVYLLIQSATYPLLLKTFGDLAYCRPLSLVIHYLAFFLTGGFLHVIRFWPYWRIPFVGKVRFH